MARTIHVNANNASVVGGGPVLTTDATTERYKRTGGVWSSVAAGVVRAGDNQFGGVSGIRTEQSATTYGNNSLSGAAVGVVGSGGSIPTFWQMINPPTVNEVISFGTESGIPYIEMNWQYDNSGGGGEYLIRIRTHGLAATNIPCASDQLTTSIIGVQQIENNSDVPVARLFWFWHDSDENFLVNNQQTLDAITASSDYPRSYVNSKTNASIAFVHNEFMLAVAAGDVLDYTFKFFGPNIFDDDHQYESFVAATSNAGVTRAADDLYLSGQSLPTELVSVIRFVTPLDLADYHSNTLLSVGGTDVLTVDASGNLDLTDGTNTATIASPTITADTVYDLVIIAKPGDGMVCGIIDTGTGTASWSTTETYDGAFPAGDIELLNGFPVASIPLYVLEDGLPEADVATTKTWVEAESAAGWPAPATSRKYTRRQLLGTHARRRV